MFDGTPDDVEFGDSRGPYRSKETLLSLSLPRPVKTNSSGWQSTRAATRASRVDGVGIGIPIRVLAELLANVCLDERQHCHLYHVVD